MLKLVVAAKPELKAISISPISPVVKQLLLIHSRCQEVAFQYESDKVAPNVMNHVRSFILKFRPLVKAGKLKQRSGSVFSAEDERLLQTLECKLAFLIRIGGKEYSSELFVENSALGTTQADKIDGAVVHMSDWDNCDRFVIEEYAADAWRLLQKLVEVEISRIAKAVNIIGGIENHCEGLTNKNGSVSDILQEAKRGLIIKQFTTMNDNADASQGEGEKAMDAFLNLFEQLESAPNFFSVDWPALKHKYERLGTKWRVIAGLLRTATSLSFNTGSLHNFILQE